MKGYTSLCRVPNPDGRLGCGHGIRADVSRDTRLFSRPLESFRVGEEPDFRSRETSRAKTSRKERVGGWGACFSDKNRISVSSLTTRVTLTRSDMGTLTREN